MNSLGDFTRFKMSGVNSYIVICHNNFRLCWWQRCKSNIKSFPHKTAILWGTHTNYGLGFITGFRGNIDFVILPCRFFWHLQSLPARGAKVLSTVTVLTILTILLSFFFTIVMYHFLPASYHLSWSSSYHLSRPSSYHLSYLDHRHIIRHSRFRLFFCSNHLPHHPVIVFKRFNVSCLCLRRKCLLEKLRLKP